MAASVECSKAHAAVGVKDVAAAVDFYTTKLGFEPGFTWGDPPRFAGVNLDKVQLFLQQGLPDTQGCSAYFVVGDADGLLELQRANGVKIAAEIGDREYGIRDYAVRDQDGNLLTFGHYIYSVGPAIPIERVDVPVRLEKRLAGLLSDLAAHKRMSVNNCLEEILLHTNDGVGPHTETTLRYIEELKKKHGIDYDSHGSYRFVEKGEA